MSGTSSGGRTSTTLRSSANGFKPSPERLPTPAAEMRRACSSLGVESISGLPSARRPHTAPCTQVTAFMLARYPLNTPKSPAACGDHDSWAWRFVEGTLLVFIYAQRVSRSASAPERPAGLVPGTASATGQEAPYRWAGSGVACTVRCEDAFFCPMRVAMAGTRSLLKGMSVFGLKLGASLGKFARRASAWSRAVRGTAQTRSRAA